MSDVKEWYKNAWYTPTMKKLKEEVDKLNQKIDEAMELPEAPSDNGSYNLVRTVNGETVDDTWETPESELPVTPQNDGKYNLVRTVDNGAESDDWEEAETGLPTDPTADGSYVLSCDVSSGVASKYWGIPVSPIGNDPEYRRANASDWIHSEITNITLS